MVVEVVGGGGVGMRVVVVEKRGADWRVARVGEGGAADCWAVGVGVGESEFVLEEG